jgi:hypothetical protein
VRQTAWLHARPKGRDGKPGEQSRLERMRGRGDAPLLPVNPAQYLTEWLFDVGPSSAGAMGEGILAYQDLAAWQSISGVSLLPWEARTLRRLSVEYLAERQKAEEQACPAPYSGEIDDVKVNRDRVAKQVDALFGKLKRKEG